MKGVAIMSEIATPTLQAPAANLRRVQGLIDYLDRIAADRLITPEMALLTWDAWNKLSVATENTLPVPDACPGPDGELLYTWDHEEHHLELEIFPDQPAEFFYRSRRSSELWECEYVIGESLPNDTLARLQLFT
jgi:hypothetical protein